MPDQRNMLDQTKMTAPIPAVGAAGEQSQNKKSNDIIPKDRKNNNSLHTLSMTELYDTTYPPKAAIIDGLLYAGTYLFVGAPKIGKSFFMAQLSYHVATGTSLWQYDVHPGEVLYLALEDDYARHPETPVQDVRFGRHAQSALCDAVHDAWRRAARSA